MANEWSIDTEDWAIADESVYVENPEYIQVTTDSDSKILQGIKPDGTSYIGGDLQVEGNIINEGIQEQIDTAIQDMQEEVEEMLSDAEETLSYFESVENPELLSVTTDSEGKIIGGRKKDGTFIENVGIEFNKAAGGTLNLNQLNLSIEGIENLKEDLDITSKGGITVNIDFSQKRVAVISELSQNYDVENTMVWKDDDSYTYNPCLNYGGTNVIDKTTKVKTLVNGEGDNIGAAGAGGMGYIGGNHGLAMLGRYKVSNHDKTFADIGSKWEVGNDIFVLVRVEPEYLSFISTYTYNTTGGAYTFKVPPTAGSTLTHYEDAAHTGNIILGEKTDDAQWYPSEDVLYLKFILDGKELTESGEYFGNQLDVLEVYEVYAPEKYLDKLISLVGTLTSNPLPRDYKDELERIIRYSNDYRFTKGGCSVLLMDWMALRKLSFFTFNPLDTKILAENAFGGAGHFYLPKMLPITLTNGTYDFRVPKPYVINDVIHLTEDYWENPLLPPDRSIMFIGDSNGKRIIGLHSGFTFDQGVSSGTNRKDYFYDWFINEGSRANYGNAIQREKVGDPLDAYTHYGMVCYRKYEDYTDNPNGLISLSQFEVNNEYYVYADFEASGLYNISIPSEWCGKEYTIFEKSNNVELECSLSQSLMLVKVETSNPMYGYIVLGIKKDNN